MRRFSSYGPINTKMHYYAPRETLIEKAVAQLVGEDPGEGGHYITVWAPRQSGKTTIMKETLFRLRKDPRFDVIVVNLEVLKDKEDPGEIIAIIARKIGEALKKQFTGINDQDLFQEIFKKEVLEKPLILIMDEFDALPEKAINAIVSAFRNIYNIRQYEADKPLPEKTYRLHAVALIGVRRALGIENEKGSPFNVQRSLQIENLTFEEVQGMFQWYQRDSGQDIEPAVIERLYQETKGQPGITCWMGELLTEGFKNHPNDPSKPIRLADFEHIYQLALKVLPNNNIINLISKAKVLPYKHIIIELFKTESPMEFRFDDEEINYLYMNGIIEPQVIANEASTVKFASPFVQKRLFNYFSRTIFKEMGKLTEVFYNVPEYLYPDRIDIPVVLNLYQSYLSKNRGWLFKDAPRRSDLRIYEAVFHFNLYAYLSQLLWDDKISIYPEFPTGNGKIDLLIRYTINNNIITHGIELKSFTNQPGYRDSLQQTALYGQQLGLREIFMVSFVDSIDEASQKKYQTPYIDPQNQVTVYPIFLQTGVI